jgi:GxxExxY protein
MEQKDLLDGDTEGKGSQFSPIPSRTEAVAKTILDAAYQVHTALGPGMLESVYEACMVHELGLRNIEVKSQVNVPVVYKGMKVESGFRLDLLVEGCGIVEIKSAEIINPVYNAQLLTYLRLTNIRLGLLINFNVIHLRNGIKRLIN